MRWHAFLRWRGSTCKERRARKPSACFTLVRGGHNHSHSNVQRTKSTHGRVASWPRGSLIPEAVPPVSLLSTRARETHSRGDHTKHRRAGACESMLLSTPLPFPFPFPVPLPTHRHRHSFSPTSSLRRSPQHSHRAYLQEQTDQESACFGAFSRKEEEQHKRGETTS